MCDGVCMQAAGLVDRIIREHADDILDSDKAVRRVEAERHSQLASARVRSLHSVTCPLHMPSPLRPPLETHICHHYYILVLPEVPL